VKEWEEGGVKFESHSLIVFEVKMTNLRLEIILSITIKNRNITAIVEIIDPKEDIIFHEKKESG